MDGDEPSQHLTYNPSSPAFDYLPLRRVKPLPKRKRSSPEPARSPSLLNTMLPPILPPPPGPDATAEELIAHAEVLSAQITFQSYFLPSLTGVPDFTRRTTTAATTTTTTIATTNTITDGDGGVETMPSVDVASPTTANESREGDHADQMQQQGNAKKRKVPAHLSGSQMGPDSADVHSAGEEEGEEEEGLSSGAERGGPLPTNNGSSGFAASSSADAVPDEQEEGPSPSGGGGTEMDGGRRRGGRVLPATMVGLRQKEMLKYRRRQLAAALGMPAALGDSLALDQALLAKYALLNESGGRSGMSRNSRLKSRWVCRRASRVVGRHRSLAPARPSETTRRIFPDGEFTFTRLNAGVSFLFGSFHARHVYAFSTV